MKFDPKSEPVMIAAILTALAGFLVAKGILTATDASALVQALVPIVVIVVGVVVRHFVTPAATSVPPVPPAPPL